jgi:hypothetical protein
MIAGSLIGATAAVIAMPYLEPQVRRMMNRGRQAINTHVNHMDKMETGVT